MLRSLLDLGRTYQVYWSGTLLMQISSQIFLVLLAWQFTDGDSADDYSYLIYVLSNAPFVLLTFLSAYLCKQWSFRMTHVFGQVLMIIAACIFWIYTAQDVVAYALLSIFLWHAGIAIRGPAYHATIALLFVDKQRDSAFAWHSIAVNVSRIAGPAIASWIVITQASSAWLAFIFVSIGVTLFAILGMDKNREKASTGPSLFVNDRKVLRRLGVVFLVSALLISVQALLPALVRQTFGDIEILTALIVAWSLGAILGSFYQAKLRTLLGTWENTLLLMAVVLNMGVLAYARSVELCALATFVGGAAQAILFLRLKTDFLQLRTSGESAALLSGFFFVNYLGYTSGAAFWGWMAQMSSPGSAFLVLAIVSMLLTCLWAMKVLLTRFGPWDVGIVPLQGKLTSQQSNPSRAKRILRGE